MSAERPGTPAPAPLSAVGDRVRIHTPTSADLQPYRRAVEESAERLRPWNPVNPADLAYHLRIQSATHRTFLVRALDPHGAHDVVGKVNVTNIVRGRAYSATLGYDSYDPYAGQGLFAEGLRLVVDLAFEPEPTGLGLHRVEASVQPGNTRSAGLLRRLGFRRRGAWPDYLWLSDAQGRDAWRDHVTFGVSRHEWPAEPFAPHLPARPVVVLLAGEGAASRGARAVGRQVAVELDVPLLRDVRPGDPGGPDPLVDMLADAVTGAVVLTGRGPDELAPLLVEAPVGEGLTVADPAALRTPGDVVRLALAARATAGIGA